jgi:hypothetical protein
MWGYQGSKGLAGNVHYHNPYIQELSSKTTLLQNSVTFAWEREESKKAVNFVLGGAQMPEL